jgi:hypothetical protein
MNAIKECDQILIPNSLILRQAMLINGMVYKSEAWGDDIKLLKDVDESFLRPVFKAHSKTPLEFLNL